MTEFGRRIFGAAACSLALLDTDDEHLVFRAASGAGAGEVLGLRLAATRGIAGWVVSSGQAIAVHDVRADPRFASDVAQSTGYVPRSILAAPMIAAGEAVGVVEVLDATRFTDREGLDLVTLLAALGAVAVEVLAASAPVTPPGPSDVVRELARLGGTEQRAALVLLTEFLDYLGRRGGTAGVV
jgi:GAF domain-containing protein